MSLGSASHEKKLSAFRNVSVVRGSTRVSVRLHRSERRSSSCAKTAASALAAGGILGNESERQVTCHLQIFRLAPQLLSQPNDPESCRSDFRSVSSAPRCSPWNASARKLISVLELRCIATPRPRASKPHVAPNYQTG